MSEAENKMQQQIVDKIKNSTNILVTVSKDPSVDELSAAIGLTALLNKIGKHTTAIFSGILPPAITFLEPDKVFENSANGLRDFIIALDKEKADHLRYKVEGDVVKIFITPYRTTISNEDLEFSQGDYNVELVLALGVSSQDYLDTALLAQNKEILDDVTIATFTAGEGASQLGSIDWCDTAASGYSEMVALICESLKTDKSLIDKQIATALLTGIVSSTDRFSNLKTSSEVMTTAAKLMAAGADQHLIASKLQESHKITSLPSSMVGVPEVDGMSLAIPKAAVEPVQPNEMGSLVVSHEAVEEKSVESVIEPSVELSSTLPTPSTEEPISDAIIQAMETIRNKGNVEPLLGGILNATSDQAAEDARRELEDQQNKTILTHSYLGAPEVGVSVPFNGVSQSDDSKMIDILADEPVSTIQPDVTPASIGLPLPPPIPDFSTLPSVTSTLPEFNAQFLSEPTAESMSTLSSAQSTDPAQFQIPS